MSDALNNSSESVLGLARQPFSDLVFLIAPGAESGSGFAGEDDGMTLGYIRGEGANVTLEYSRGECEMLVGVGVQGEWEGMPRERTVTVRIPLALPPKQERGIENIFQFYFDVEKL